MENTAYSYYEIRPQPGHVWSNFTYVYQIVYILLNIRVITQTDLHIVDEIIYIFCDTYNNLQC